MPWSAWLVPLFFWVPFVLVSYTMLGCLSVMLRKQWAEHEALTFPLLRLPLEMTQNLDGATPGATPFSRNGLMWSGFGVAVVLQAARGLNLYYPDFPTIPLEIPTGALFSEAPWNQIGSVPIQLFPLAVAVVYLLTSEVSFSLWIFFWFLKFQLIAAYLAGYPAASLAAAPAAPGKLFQSYQVWGCYLAYVGLLLYTARHHLRHVLLRATGRAVAHADEHNEVLSYPGAFWGFALSFAAMVGATVAAGVRLDIALALWVSYLIIAVGLSRLVVEAGMLLIINQSMPLGTLARLLPDGWLTHSSGLAPAALFQSGLVYHMRGLIMPSFLHAFKLAHDREIQPKRLGWLIAGIIVLSVMVSFMTTIRLGYESGALGFGHKWFTQIGATKAPAFVDAMLRGNGTNSPLANWFWTGTGAAVTLGLMMARGRFLALPIHPLGYLVSLAFPLEVFWTSIFIGWLVKVLIGRFGGTDAVRGATPCFLGLALGDISMMLFWLLVDSFTGRAGHSLVPV